MTEPATEPTTAPMLPITRADEELFSTVTVAVRLGRADAIVERLAARYEEEWDNPLAGFPYALSMIAAFQSTDPELRERLNYPEVVETLNDLLYNQPDHWLGRYLRIHARTLLPVNPREYRAFIAAEREKATEDAEQLIERQSRTVWQPYFACSYLAAARLAWETSKDPDKVAELVKQATARPGAPVPFPSLGSILCEVFLWYRNEAGLPDQDAVAETMGALFPDQPAVRLARGVRSP